MEIHRFPEQGRWAVPLHQHAAEGSQKASMPCGGWTIWGFL